MINRHDEHCNTQQRQPHFSGMKCECGVAAGDPHWYNRKLLLLDLLALGFAKCQHYQEFNGRLDKFFKEALPDYSVALYPAAKDYESHKVQVWGGPSQPIRFDDGIHLRLFKSHEKGADNSWSNLFKLAMKRERESLEQSLAQVDNEDRAEDTFSRYQHNVKEIITSARIVASHTIGESVSSDFRKAFPVIFNTDI